MANEFTERMRSVGYLARGRTRARVREGRSHPETSRAWKTTVTEAGSVTEHNTKDDRVDAVPRVESVRAIRDPRTGRVTNGND